MSAHLPPAPLRLSLAALLAFLLPLSLAVGPAEAKKRKRAPVAASVTGVTPAKAGLGDLLVIKGKNFSTSKSTVLFRKASGGRFVFATTVTASKTRLTVKVPDKIVPELDVQNGAPVETRFQLRIVSSKASTGFTATTLSPVILPPVGVTASTDCDKDGVIDGLDADDDNDGLSDAIEVQYGTQTCNVDTDADGMWDSWEFESALDLNTRALPYPGKKPWPNPLDSSDAGADFDGDGLNMSEEHKLWQGAGRPFPLNYSDGDQYTGGPVLAPVPDSTVLDTDRFRGGKGSEISLVTGVGYLSDDEKDFDGDGLSNINEFSHRGTKGFWDAYGEDLNEAAYSLRPFSGTDPTDPDSDGDGVLDGYDDQDADGWNNISELYRAGTAATDYVAYMVNPFNPCLPDYNSRTCSRYIPIGDDAWAPFHLPIAVLPSPIIWDVARNQAAGLPEDDAAAPAPTTP